MSIKKFKVGDKVRIKEGLVGGRDYGVYFNKSMERHNGKMAEIISDEDYYKLDIDDSVWNWTDEMLEPVNENKEQPKYVKCIDNKDTESELEIGKIYKIKKIHKGLYAFVNEGDGYEIEGFTYSFYSSRFVPVSNPQPQSTKSMIKIRQVGDTTYATYNTHGKGKSTRNSSIDEYNKEYGILLATARALNISEDKVKGIIDVLFDENKEETKEIVGTGIEFKVGDRVVGIGYYWGRNIEGIEGTVREIIDNSEEENMGVAFDKNIDGHTLSGHAKYGYGLWVNKESIKLISQSKDERIKELQQENQELRGELNNIKDKIKSLLD